ncbi:triose-phosphate isomerase [Methylobacillus arboreus]|uniref:triose-phosphate isomerase n=1 Tax=Methylobacillus arboreus TaxID=755170 RepID=UPI001E50EC03|nr:triose-phosphate isomerase [Methylobacillus arboreus]MCB5189172.1 triose-phosphate isomerase [Methylobacillus arboreus]
MRRKLVVGNWKMNGNLAQNQRLLEALVHGLKGVGHVDIAVCVPYPYLFQAQHILTGTNIAWGAQNVASHENGAYTGEVSAAMLKEFGASYVIVGHSERSDAYCESSANIADKFAIAKQHGITPIFCVGETLQERESGVMEYAIANQLDAILSVSGGALLDRAVIAYEPVWAIGTNKNATSEQARAAHSFIRERIAAMHPGAAESARIIYGGSVNPRNAAQLLSMSDIDGGLIGRCSLDANDFERICRAACKI